MLRRLAPSKRSSQPSIQISMISCLRCLARTRHCFKARAFQAVVHASLRDGARKTLVNYLWRCSLCVRMSSRELCESRGGRPGLPVPRSLSLSTVLCGREATLNLNFERKAIPSWEQVECSTLFGESVRKRKCGMCVGRGGRGVGGGRGDRRGYFVPGF